MDEVLIGVLVGACLVWAGMLLGAFIMSRRLK